MIDQLDEEYIKRRLFHLELKSKLNERKLVKMYASNEYSEIELTREAELNEFMRAQIDYYRRKLDTSRHKLTSLDHEHNQLTLDYKMLVASANSTASSSYIQAAFEEAQRQYEASRAKLNYFDSKICSLDENLSHKRELLARLSDELKIIEQQTADAATTTTSESGSETESSSESLSNLLSDASCHKMQESPTINFSSLLFSDEEKCVLNERRKAEVKLSSRRKFNSRVKVNNNLEDIYFF